jgi:hypothetical protein
MANISFTQAAAALGITGNQLNALMRNSACPAPTANAGNVAGITFDQGQITTLAATLASARANGWQVSSATQLATAPLATMAAATPGAGYKPALTDPLFDDFP